jgi:hypothetical protein
LIGAILSIAICTSNPDTYGTSFRSRRSAADRTTAKDRIILLCSGLDPESPVVASMLPRGS